MLHAQDINISSAQYFDSEPSLAVNPTNQQNVVAAWMGLTGIKVSAKTKASFDGGLTWSAVSSLPHYSITSTSADVSLAFNSSGKCFYSFIDFHKPDSGAVFVSASSNGGLNWSAPVKAIDGMAAPQLPLDRPWIAVDNSGGTYDGRIYVTAMTANWFPTNRHVFITFSDDDGLSWSTLKQVDTAGFLCTNVKSMLIPTVTADGKLNCAYISYDVSGSLIPRMIDAISVDGGDNFSFHSVLQYTSTSVIDTDYQFSYCMVAHPTDANKLWMGFTNWSNGDPDIYVYYSSNGGINWNSGVKVNDDGVMNGIGQDMLWMNVSPTGIVGAAWRDRRNYGQGATTSFDIYGAVSVDGVNWSANKMVSDNYSPFSSLTEGNDFLGICLNDNFLMSDWGDYRGNHWEIYYNRVPLSEMLGVNQLGDLQNDFYLKQNPSNDFLELVSNGNFSSLDISVFNLVGEKIYSGIFSGEKNSSIKIPVKNISNGVYLVKIKSAEGNSTLRWVKM